MNMINGLLLASSSFFGGRGFGDLLTTWEQMGFFTYVLPFLLIFSMVFGVLSKTKLFEDNKSINVIIALAVGLMSLQWDLVPQFFSAVFPRAGIGMAFILIVILFLGIFLPKENWTVYIFFTIAVVVVIAVLLNTTEVLGWRSAFIPDFNSWGELLFWVVVIGCFALAIKPEKPKPSFDSMASPFFKSMHK